MSTDTGPRALVVDDQRVNQLLAQHLLQQLGFVVELADDGEQAVLAVQTGGFDLVLMDLQMPTMDGWQATRLIRQWEQQQAKTRIPIIALTAYSESASREHELSVGIDGYLPKPLTLKALQTALLETRPNLPVADSSPGNGPKYSPVSRQRMLARLGHDEAALQDMVKAFRIDLRKCLNQTWQGMQSQDWALVDAQAHGLKGLLSSMTAEAAAADARALELAARAGDAVGAKAAFSELSGSAKLAFDAVKTW